MQAGILHKNSARRPARGWPAPATQMLWQRARTAKITPEEGSARKAAKARWEKKRREEETS